MAKPEISHQVGQAAVLACLNNEQPSRNELAIAVRYSLAELAKLAPGNSVEVRVPPFAAVQCIAGPKHTRGTPSNTIELSPKIWVALAVGALRWEDAVTEGLIQSSGIRADLTDYLPLMPGLNR